jgi:streptogramin lyase
MKSQIIFFALLTILTAAAVLQVPTSVNSSSVAIVPGDIVVANSGSVSVFDAQTGSVKATFPVGSSRLIGVAVNANSKIIVADRDNARILEIDPASGTISTVSAGNLLMFPTGVAIADNGDIIVADSDSCCGPGNGHIVHIDPITGSQTEISAGGGFVNPTGVELEESGSILVADFNARKLFRIDAGTGSQSDVANFFPDGEPYDVVFGTGSSAYVVDHNFKGVYKVDLATGNKTLVSSGGVFDQPVGIAVEQSGNVLVTDITTNSIVRVDVSNGAQSVVHSGIPSLVNPWGIAVVPAIGPTYDFTGFNQPVDNMPELNVAPAGSSIPVKFSLGGDQGLNILSPGYPVSGQVACNANEPGSTVEETINAGSSTLAYDLVADRYIYVWKTNKSWKNTCRILVVRLADGSDHFARFTFK